MFITFEGPEGSGKTTQVRFLKDLFKNRGIPCLFLREPGGTDIGDSIRKILLDPLFTKMSQRSEILLYAASRAQLVAELIKPALERGEFVICDRYVDSSLVYQGMAPSWDLHEVVEINRIATGGCSPDRTYLLDIPVEVQEERIVKRGISKDRMEQKDSAFHQRVREGYLTIAQNDPKRFCVVQADRDPEEVFKELVHDLKTYIGSYV